jgi:tetratricopeptide (TPR) repeat protein
MLSRAWLVAPLLALLAAPAASGPASLADVLASTPADSLPGALKRLESTARAGSVGGQAVMVLGQLHFARGEFREAAAAFGRAAARLDPAAKPEARYAQGLAFLGLGEPTQARSALEEVARTSSLRRIGALLGVAQAWELDRRPERAFETLAPLLDDPLGESGATVLDRIGALAERFNQQEQARRARERLLRDYPRSIEAASARLTLAASAPRAGAGTVAVVIGQFVDRSRAHSLASEAKRAGFPNAQVVTRGQGLSAIHVVRLGVFGNTTEARQAGEQATRALGVTYDILRSP